MYSKKQQVVFKILAFIIALSMIATSFVYVFAEESQIDIKQVSSKYGEAFIPLIGAEVTPVAEDLSEKIELTDSEKAGEQLDFLNLVMDYIYEEYVYDVTYDQLVNGAYKGVFDALDRYSVYFSERESYEDFVQAVEGEFSGIGVTMESHDGQTRIVTILPDTPAAKAGLKAGDIIIAVDDVKDIPYPQMPSKLKGKEGTEVKVTVLRNDTTLNFTIKRGIVKISSVAYEMKSSNIGYIKLSGFNNSSRRDFSNAIKDLKSQGMTSLIVDIRDNGGGLIDTSLEIAKQLVPKGELMHFVKKGKVTKTYRSETKGLEMPLALLVNEYSASAAEILAGAVKDNKAGTLIGTQTFGKGVAQTAINLKNGGGLKLTVSSFVTPNHTTIEGIGITPDIIVQEADAKAAEVAKAKVESFAPMIETAEYKAEEKGLNVYAAQQRLQYLDYIKVKLTGVMDTETVEAIKQFQSFKGLKSNGVLNIATRDAIEKAIDDKIRYFEQTAESDTQLDKAIELLKGGAK